VEPSGTVAAIDGAASAVLSSAGKLPGLVVAAVSTEVVSTFALVAPRVNSYAAGPVLACVCTTISDWHAVLHVQPTRNWKQSILTDEGDEGLK